MGHVILLGTIFTAHVLCAAAAAPGTPRPVASATRLVPGADGAATARGSVVGYALRDFVIHAGAGQDLAIGMETSRTSGYFDVHAPGSKDAAMFIGSTSGSRFRGRAPIAGDYLVRVYQMRSAARRNEAWSFRLTARASGRALVPLASSTDARIRGTPFHARATVTCTIPYEVDVKECEASVIRYAYDGTATVVLRSPGGFLRRILFEKGKPVASDATETPTFTRKDDVTSVRIGTEESFEIPDALLMGG